MALISTEQLKKIIETYLDASDINMDSDAYAALDKVSAVTGLMNKIAATFTIEGDYTEEGLADLDGPEITNGNAMEEYFRDFIEPQEFDETGANALAPSYPHEAPVSYSVEQEIVYVCCLQLFQRVFKHLLRCFPAPCGRCEVR